MATEDTNEQSAKPNREYMRTWGSTRQVKEEFAAEAEDNVVEAKRPGVTPVVPPKP